MTIDDFEWVERGFDEYVLVHKTHELTIAAISNFSGWQVRVLKTTGGALHLGEHIDNLEAAKVIAAIHVNQNMEGYPNVSNYRPRTPKPRPEAFPKGVFKVDRIRR